MAEKIDKSLPMREGEQALVDAVNELIDGGGGTEVNSIAPLVVESAPNVVDNTSTAFGNLAYCAAFSTTIGYNANCAFQNGVSIGANSSSKGTSGIAIGTNAYSYTGGVSIGYNATISNSTQSIAIGGSASVDGSATKSVAIGSQSKAAQPYTFAVGSTSQTRRIVNVTDPTSAQDAVTKNYLDNRISASLATYLATLPDIEYGYIDVGTIAGSTVVTKTITFASTKTEAPSIFVTPYVNSTANAIVAHITAASTTSATVAIRNVSSASISNITLDWLAISGR